MKKLSLAVLAFVLAAPVAAWSATSSYVSSFQPGTYEGTITSVIPELNGQKVALEVKQLGSNVVGTVTYEGGKEIWTWNDTTLNQREVNPKDEKVVQTYNATAKTTPTTTAQTFNINCAKGNAECDAGIDHRNSWTLTANGSEIKYIVNGVTKDQATNPAATAVKRHEFTFKKK